jgi:AcrR family transcriptional regulator
MARPRSRSDEQVLAATLRAVGEHGVARLTLADVARHAGLAPSTLAERFGSKRALLLAAARSAVRSLHDVEAPDPVEFLVALAAPVADRRAFAHHLALLELDVSDPEFRAAAADYVEAVLARLRGFGLTAPEARALYVAYNGALVLWALTGDGPLEDALRADLQSAGRREPKPVAASNAAARRSSPASSR